MSFDMNFDFLQYDEEMLFEDLNFPLKNKNGILVDCFNNLLIEDIDEEIAEVLHGKYREVESVIDKYYYNMDCEILNSENDVKICQVKIWHIVSKKDAPTARMKNVMNYLTDRLNAE